MPLPLVLPGLWSAPCEDGQQQFKGYGWPGLITEHPTGTEDYSIRGKFVVSSLGLPSQRKKVTRRA